MPGYMVSIHVPGHSMGITILSITRFKIADIGSVGVANLIVAII